MSSKRTFLVTGTSRGIGLELTRVLLEKGNHVIATARNPSKSEHLTALQKSFPDTIRVEQLDVNDANSINALAEKLKKENVKINVLVNNAGVGLSWGPLEQTKSETVVTEYLTNSVSVLNVTQAFLPLLHGEPFPVVASISSTMGSITLGTNTHELYAYGYRMSKAALNMFTRILASQHKEIVTVSLCPGWVKTDLGGENAQLSPRDSANGLTSVIEGLKKEDSGSFINLQGKTVPF